ncbi:MAG TPA: hypothetical protein VGB13_13080, partial [Candidatus Krumholzibacteria bacterium]
PQGLDAIESVGGDLFIYLNNDLSDLKGLAALRSIGADLFVGYNLVLTSLEGLEGIRSLAGGVQIRNLSTRMRQRSRLIYEGSAAVASASRRGVLAAV